MNYRRIALVGTILLLFHSVSWANNNLAAGGGASPSTWEIRNSSGGFVSGGNWNRSRWNHCGVTLTTGNVFLAGGTIAPSNWEIRNSSGALVSSGSVNATRDVAFTCTRLSAGNILIVGGQTSAGTWEIRNSSRTREFWLSVG